MNTNHIITFCTGYSKNREEWYVECRIDGRFNDDLTYYTDDESDACATLDAQVEWYKLQAGMHAVKHVQGYYACIVPSDVYQTLAQGA